MCRRLHDEFAADRIFWQKQTAAIISKSSDDLNSSLTHPLYADLEAYALDFRVKENIGNLIKCDWGRDEESYFRDAALL